MVLDLVTALGVTAAVQQLVVFLGQTLLQIDKYCADVRDSAEQAIQLRNELGISVVLSSQVWAILEGSSEETKHSLDMAIRDFLGTVRRISKRIQDDQVIGGKRFIWPFKKHETDTLMSQIKSYQETFHFALSVVEMCETAYAKSVNILQGSYRVQS